MRKVLVLAFVAFFSLICTNVWGTTWKKGGVKIVSNGDSLTISAIDPEGEGTRGVMPDFDDFDGSGSNKRPSAWSYGIYKIVVNEGVTTIGRYAFQEIANISTVKLPESLTTIKANAFRGCEGVRSIYYKGTPAQWASIDFQGSTAQAHPFGGTKSTGDYYFYGGTTKADPIAIEPTITQIKNFAFYRCNVSNGLNIPGTITQIGDSALYGTIGGTIVIRAKQAPTLIGSKAFVFTNSKIYVPVGATGYTSGLWDSKTKSPQDTIGTTLGTKGENVTWHMSYDGILTLDATNGAKSITIDAANTTDMPWYYFRRLVYKVKIRGEATALNNLLHYHFGISEVILDQVTIPTISSTYIATSTSTAYAALFNKRDKLTLTITDPASQSHASWSNLESAPWNDDTHWRIVYPSSCSDWSLHYGTDGEADWNEECFTYTGSSNEWQIEDFVIPDKPNWYVDNATGDDAKKTLSDWGDLYFAASQGDGDRPMVGDATGAIGTVRIYDNSTWNNRYAGFIPNGYVLKFGSDEYSFALESSNVFHSEIIEYNSTSANYNVSVGIENADREYVSTDHTQEMRHIFLKDDCNWSGDYAKLAIYYWNGGDNGWCGFLQLVPGETGLYEGWIPSGYTNLKFVRFNSSKTSVGNWDDKWNETGDLSIGSSDNMFTMSAFSSGSWSTYERKGKFVIHTDYTDKNWYVRFQPHYVLHFDANGGEGAPEDQSVAINAAPCQLTVSSTEPTRTGYDFLGWSTNSDATSPDEAWDPGDTHAMTGDVTLYAVWSPATLTFNASENANWSNANNWSPNSLPTINHDVIINKPAVVNTTSAVAKSVIINQADDNTGKIEIAAGQKLIVANTIRKTTDGESLSATDADDITIHSDGTNGLGALVMGTHDGTNKATVNFYTKSNGEDGNNTSVGQYVGTPFNDENNILYNWYNSWVYGITYSGAGAIDWYRVNEGEGMNPFKGYCVFSADGTGHSYWQQGTLVASANQTLGGLNWQSGSGTANANNENLLANSWVAPIKINAMESSDFTNADATVYIFNSTSNSAYVDLGNYATYPVNSAADAAIIPSMQSFSVFTTGSGASVSLDYGKIVYDPAVGGTVPGPNKAPRLTKAETAHRMKLYVSAENGYSDMLYLLEHLDFEEGFENGWDGHKLFGESVAPQLYAVTPDGNMAVNCVPTYEGVVLGFKAGEQDKNYTFRFEYDDESQPLYLLDISTNAYTQIMNENHYSFITSDNEAHNRFVLTYNAPSVTTSIDNTTSPSSNTGQKVIYNNHLYIIRNGRVFSAQGMMVK